MLTKPRNPTDPSSTSKHSEASAGSSSRSSSGSPPARNQNHGINMREAPREIQEAQQILARIAVRIVEGRKTDEAK